LTHLTGHLQYTSPFFQPFITVVEDGFGNL
jgi:hypothetical protein